MVSAKQTDDAFADLAARDGRQQAAIARARRHTRRVRIMKIALPALAGIATLGFVAFALLGRPTLPDIALDAIGLSDGRIVMNNPRMDGMTDGNRPYSIVAEKAFQEPTIGGKVELQGITAELPISDTVTASVRAAGGLLDNAERTMALTDEVVMTTDDGMIVRLKSADIDMGEGTLVTNDPVDIERQNTHITAETMQVRDRGALLVFERRVRVVIQPEALSAFRGRAPTETEQP